MTKTRTTPAGPRDGDLPARLAWAVEMVAIAPGDRVLEIGCGTGVVVDLLARQLADGKPARGRRAGARIVAIDRSKTMIAKARERNAAHLTAGRVVLHARALRDAGLAEALAADAPFDTIVAINVNAFWLAPAAEWRVLARLLAPGGSAYLVFHAPSAPQAARIARDGADLARQHGLSVTAVRTKRLDPVPIVCIIVSTM